MYKSTQSPALLLSDVESAVNVYEVTEAEFATESVRSAKGLSRECREMVDVLRLA
jgi:hypothetical protein